MRKPIIAIDGPAGSGKSTTAKAVAKELGYVHVDSGAVYRACTLIALEQAKPPAWWSGEAIVEAARAKPLVVRAERGAVEVLITGRSAEPAIRSPEVTAEVARVAAMDQVREYVNGLLRAAAAQGGVVMDGRDIGTVVFPDAEVKVFMVAEPDERARRRLAEQGARFDRRSVQRERSHLEARDTRDSTRSNSPLAMAEGAVVIDTTRLAFEEQVAKVVELAKHVG
ncbi:MAG: (d)CMP kinase [Gemmatimonadales bacterium]